MSGTREYIYWDSNIFIAWLKDEERPDSEKNGIEEQATLFDKDGLFICTSTITLTEILRSQIRPDQYKKFGGMTRRPNFVLENVTRRVAETAQEIRDFYSKLQDEVGATLTTPDAIHLATAIQLKCAKFYTFDGKNKSSKSRALLPLSGTIANRFYMTIERPSPSPKFQPKLPGMN